MKRTSQILAGFALLIALAAQAQLQYQVTNGAITITGYTGSSGAVVIPAAINGLPVTRIGDGALGGLGLSSITIPGSVTNIGANAFYPDTVSNITVAAANPVYSSVNGVLFNKSQTTLIRYPWRVGTYIIPDSVTSIGPNAFEGSALTRISIPDGVASIACGAFESSALTNVTIPDTVTNVEAGAFSYDSWLISVDIPAGVAKIGTGAFEACTSLTNITVAAQNAFYSSPGGVLFDKNQTTLIQYPILLGSVFPSPGGAYIVPNTVTNIADKAFERGDLRSVTIGNGVIRVGNGAFEMSALAGVTIPGGVASIGQGAFENCFSLTSVTVPGSVIDIAGQAFENAALTNVTIGDGVLSIGNSAFADCQSLASVTIPESVTNIGTAAFSYTGLTSIAVARENAFYSSLNGVLFNKNQTALLQFPGGVGGAYAVPNGVVSVAEAAFEDCSLSSVTIPATVTNIGDAAFFNCGLAAGGFADAYFRGNAPAVGVDAFDRTLLPWLTVPGGPAYYLPGTTGWESFSAETGVWTVLWNPVIQTGDGAFGVRNGQFGFNIAATTNDLPVMVETCTDLANPAWTSLRALWLTNSLTYFSEPLQTNAPSRFYRLNFP